MAFEIPDGLITVPATTGLTQFRLVALDSAGKAAYPSAGTAVDGSIVGAGTTGSTVDPQYITIATRGVVKVSALASTVSAGDTVTATSVGHVSATTAGDYVIGRVVSGTSGSTGRILSVLLSPIGTT